ncbi:MAG: beta family protein [Anaerolineaceae bacterium]|nr:beta family protein [Anaerolineaceae bacterium]
MTIGSNQYIPCLRWKQGEYQALSRLSLSARDSIVPLIEVAEIGFDFETKTDSKTIDEHLRTFANRVRQKWGISECFIDMRYIEPSELMSDGQHPGEFIFNDLRSKGVLAIPAIRIQEELRYQAVIHQVVKTDGRGLCIRVNIEEVAKRDFDKKVQDLILGYKLSIEECDFIIDLISPNFDPIDRFAVLLTNYIQSLPNLERWRSFGIIGTSFPKNLSGLTKGISIFPRNEWRLYKLLVAQLNKIRVRIPSFGDYAINHPDLLSLDMRLLKPNASVRYTIDEKWLVAKGQNVRDFGFDQYKELCQKIIRSKYYYGTEFSEGDKYIYSCANDKVSTGNLSTWRWVGTNHHIETVAKDVAKLAAS